MEHMDTQLQSLDEIVSRVRAQNNAHHTAHTESLQALSATVQSSYTSIGDHLSTSFTRVQSLDADVAAQTTAIKDTLPTLSEGATIRAPLNELREAVTKQNLIEYNPTGETPQRITYSIPAELPRTEAHETLLSRLRDRPASSDANRSPSKGLVFNDATNSTVSPDDLFSSTLSKPSFSRSISANSGPGMSGPGLSLRELDVNVVSQDVVPLASPSDLVASATTQVLKKQNRGDGGDTKLPMKKMMARKTVAGAFGASQGPSDRENLTITNFSASIGPGVAGGRRLRSHGSQ
jgi:kinesin family member 11